MIREECRIGMRVIFGRERGEQTKGIIVKLNSVRAKVQISDARGRTDAGSVWGVPYSMMEPDVEPITITTGNEHILSAIADCYCELSPENLSCDGELPIELVRRKERQLKQKLLGLFLVFGREVSESEIYQLEKAS